MLDGLQTAMEMHARISYNSSMDHTGMQSPDHCSAGTVRKF